MRQLCNLIPNHLAPKLARECGVDKKARTFSPWSHSVSLLYAQLSHALSLNDVCDALRLHSGPLSAIRGATPPCRNTLSHANRQRDPAMAERLFWAVLEHLQALCPRFGHGRSFGLTRRFRRAIHLVDSTTIHLVAQCVDWARHRRRKAAAKCHLRLDLHSFLPRFAIIDAAKVHDAARARALCAGVAPGEIVLFDKAYVDFEHLHQLHGRGVFWVSRAREDFTCRVVKKLPRSKDPRVLRDELVRLKTFRSARAYPALMRRVVARVEVDGVEREMTFLSNNPEWSAGTLADLYRSRWQIEVFFKQIKQTLQLSDFLGNNERAVRWQLWSALLCYVLLRFCGCLHRWNHSFTRLFTLVRSALWQRWELCSLLRLYGTADGSFRFLGQPQQAWLAFSG